LCGVLTCFLRANLHHVQAIRLPEPRAPLIDELPDVAAGPPLSPPVRCPVLDIAHWDLHFRARALPCAERRVGSVVLS
jgi:hypothetical protein